MIESQKRRPTTSDEYEEVIAELRAEVEELKEALANALQREAALSKELDPDRFCIRLAASEADNDELRAEVEELRADRGAVTVRVNKALEAERDSLNMQVASHLSRIGELESYAQGLAETLDTLRAEVAGLQSDVAYFKEVDASGNRIISTLTAKLQAAEAEVGTLRQSCESWNELVQDLQAKVARLREALKKWREDDVTDANDLINENTRFREALEKLIKLPIGPIALRIAHAALRGEGEL
jgi:chromosome segregation ATPase